MDMTDPNAAPDAADEPAPMDGTIICLKVASDGSLSVYTEGDEAAEQSVQNVADIGAALKAILDMYRKVATATPAGGGQDQFDAGFKSPGGTESRMGSM